MTQRRRPDEEIEIGDQRPRCSETSPLPSEHLASPAIDPDERETAEEGVELTLVPLGVSGVIDAFVQLGERDHGEGKTVGSDFFEAPADSGMAVER